MRQAKTPTKDNRPGEHLPPNVSLALKDRALGAAAEGITISDPSRSDNPLIYVNSGFERLTGYSASSVLGKNCRFLQGPDTDPVAAATIRQAVANEDECTVEILNYRRDGAPFWNRLSVTPVRDDHGQATHFIGIQSDITARRDAEDRLRVANAKMKSDLAAAAKVQQAMLPHALPQAKGFQLAWHYRPCEELAGDTLNCFWLDKTHLGIYIIDVSGHGIAASLLSVTLSRMLLPVPSQSILYTVAPENPSDRCVAASSVVAARLNQQFPFDERTGQFFTMVYGVLDTHTGVFEYVSAGHPPLILLDGNGHTQELRREQFPIGIVPETEFATNTVHLQPGQRLVLYTDGITEACNEAGQQYDIQSLRDAITATRNTPLDGTVSHIVTSVEHFCGPAEIRDDISLLAIEATTASV